MLRLGEGVCSLNLHLHGYIHAKKNEERHFGVECRLKKSYEAPAQHSTELSIILYKLALSILS